MINEPETDIFKIQISGRYIAMRHTSVREQNKSSIIWDHRGVITVLSH